MIPETWKRYGARFDLTSTVGQVVLTACVALLLMCVALSVQTSGHTREMAAIRAAHRHAVDEKQRQIVILQQDSAKKDREIEVLKHPNTIIQLEEIPWYQRLINWLKDHVPDWIFRMLVEWVKNWFMSL